MFRGPLIYTGGVRGILLWTCWDPFVTAIFDFLASFVELVVCVIPVHSVASSVTGYSMRNN